MSTTTPNHTDLDSLIQRVRWRSDHENSTFVTDAELTQYIQESYFELYDLLIESLGPQHFMEAHNLVTTAGTPFYPLHSGPPLLLLPPDPPPGDDPPPEGEGGTGEPMPPEQEPPRPLNVYKMVGVDVEFNGVYRPIRVGSVYDRDHKGGDTQGWTGPSSVRYFLTTTLQDIQYRVIHFSPTPRATHNVRLLYVPTPVPLVGDGFTFGDHSFLHYAHWDEYIVLDAAAKVLEKEESDSSFLLRRLEAMRQRIRDQAHTMNTEYGGEIRDVSRSYTSKILRGEPWE